MIKFQNETGISRDTKIVNSETGEDLTRMLGIEYGAQITIEKDLIRASCRIIMVKHEASAAHTEWLTLNPVSGKYDAVRAIEFRDGSRVEISEDGIPSIIPKEDAT